MLWLLLAITTADAKQKEIKVPTVPLAVVLPEIDEETEAQEWGFSEGDAFADIKLAMRNAELFANVTFQATEYQPNLDAIEPNVVDELLQSDDSDMKITPGEIEKVDHPELGEMLVIPLDLHDSFMEQDFKGQLIVLPVQGHGVIITVVTSKFEDPDDPKANKDPEEPTHLEAVIAEVLGMLDIKEKAIPEADLPYGKVTAEAGYTVELPGGWRALTEDEARRRSNARIAGEGEFSGRLAELYVIDTAHLSELVFNCAAGSDGTLEVIDPDRYKRSADNFLTLAEVSLKGGRYRFLDGTEERFIDIMTQNPVNPEGASSLDFVELGDRDAYLWTTKGTLYDDPVSASVFYTGYDNVSLICYSVADEDEAGRLGSFEKVVRSLQVTDGELYPMHYSLKARYIRWWPTNNPFLQLYWLPIPMFLLGSWLIFKD